ncbi:MAG: hypothetical protein H3C47_03330 [Candidatus Cloacimonetes bacterium]|nr:hypothetical protein [Candidatus Cloacimonadota bacterium]
MQKIGFFSIVFATGTLMSEVSVEVGKGSEGFVEVISTSSSVLSTEVIWIPVEPPQLLPAPAPNPTVTPLIPVHPALSETHLVTEPGDRIGISGPPALAEDVLNGAFTPPTPLGDINLSRAGTQNRSALIAGTVQIRPYLFTYNTASIVVRLYEADGTEVLFGGRPLLQWRRNDDRDASGVHFKGVRDASSMVITAGDPSPRTGLSYSFTINASQKIRASMSGNPVAGTAYLRVSGPAGMF